MEPRSEPLSRSAEAAPQLSGLALGPELLGLLDELVEHRIEERIAALEARLAEQQGARCSEASQASDRATLVVFSGDMDKLLAAFTIATGAAAVGLQVEMFFTFWALAALKKTTTYRGKPLTDKMLAAMLPCGAARLATSRMNMLGLGPVFFRTVMKRKGVASLRELIAEARELGVRLTACQTSLEIMGIRREELIEGVEFGGVAVCLASARDSKFSLFI